MDLGLLGYLGVFAVTASLTLVFTPMALRVAIRRQILDEPSDIKAQVSPVPYLGGAAIVASFAIAVLVGALLKPPNNGIRDLAIVLGLGIFLAALGLLDDLRGLSPWLRLALELLVGLAVWAGPARAELTGVPALDASLTVVWIVGITNAFNLLDNMDGLSAGVAAIAGLSFFAMAAEGQQFLVATLAIALVGCALGFLRSNFHPARIYMGDAGALFLGFMLAVLGMKLRFPDGPRTIVFTVPIVVLGVPIFDTVLVTLNRLRHDRNPMSGGRDHTSHRLVFVGIPVRATVALIYVGGASLGVLGFVIAHGDRVVGSVVLIWLSSIAAVLGVLLSLVPVYESSTRRHLLLQEVARHEHELGPASEGLSDPPVESRRDRTRGRAQRLAAVLVRPLRADLRRRGR